MSMLKMLSSDLWKHRQWVDVESEAIKVSVGVEQWQGVEGSAKSTLIKEVWPFCFVYFDFFSFLFFPLTSFTFFFFCFFPTSFSLC